MGDNNDTHAHDLPEGEVVARWTFYCTLIGAVLYVGAVFLFVL